MGYSSGRSELRRGGSETRPYASPERARGAFFAQTRLSEDPCVAPA
jgi:hypothetical protein